MRTFSASFSVFRNVSLDAKAIIVIDYFHWCLVLMLDDYIVSLRAWLMCIVSTLTYTTDIIVAQKLQCQIDVMHTWVFNCYAYLYVCIVMSFVYAVHCCTANRPFSYYVPSLCYYASSVRLQHVSLMPSMLSVLCNWQCYCYTLCRSVSLSALCVHSLVTSLPVAYDVYRYLDLCSKAT